MRLRFDAPSADTLEVDGQTCSGGQTFEVDDERAQDLIADFHVPVSVYEPPPADDIAALTRPELNNLATKAGIENPGALASKKAVIAAIKTNQPDAIGEGQTNAEKEQ